MTESTTNTGSIVLHVEDQDAFQRALQRRFRPNKIDCRAVGLVSEAAPFVADHHVAAFIIDRRLPLDDEANFEGWGAYSHDALGLLRKIRRERPEAPVAVLTGFADDRDLLELIHDGTIERANVWDKANVDLDDFVRKFVARLRASLANAARAAAEAPVVLNAWFEGGIGEGLQVGVARRLFLTVGAWDAKSLLGPPAEDRAAGLSHDVATTGPSPQVLVEPDSDATFRFIINSGHCSVDPVRPNYTADLCEPAAFDVSLVEAPSAGEVTLVIAVQREGVVLHVEQLSIASTTASRGSEEAGSHG